MDRYLQKIFELYKRIGIHLKSSTPVDKRRTWPPPPSKTMGVITLLDGYVMDSETSDLIYDGSIVEPSVEFPVVESLPLPTGEIYYIDFKYPPPEENKKSILPDMNTLPKLRIDV